MLKIEYNDNENWFSKVTIKDTACYYDKDGNLHRLDGPANCQDEQWLYKNRNVTYNFKKFVEKNEAEMNEENFKIFLFEWKLKNT